MKLSSVAPPILLLILWLGTTLLFASQVNNKGYVGDYNSQVNDGPYNFEYKLGFPSPWDSKYYLLEDGKTIHTYQRTTTKTCRLFDNSCAKIPTPPAATFVSEDRALNILAVQAGLALLPAGLIGLIYFTARRYAHSRH